MAIAVIMPALDVTQESGKLLGWKKRAGERVSKGEAILEIETDKAIVEVEAPGDGILAGIRAEEGAVVPFGDTIAWLVQEGEAVPEAQASVKLAPEYREEIRPEGAEMRVALPASGAHGRMRAHDSATGELIWEFDSARDFEALAGVPARGGSFGGGAAPVFKDGMMYLMSGYGIYNHMPGNLLLVFEVLMAERSVTRAANRLWRTQSAVSHALARLREQLPGNPRQRRPGQTHTTTATKHAWIDLSISRKNPGNRWWETFLAREVLMLRVALSVAAVPDPSSAS